MATTLLLPAVVLIIWSLIMLFWMAATRVPAAAKLGVDITGSVGGRGADIDPQVPASVAWKSHNYTHLMEQPTIFYPAVIIIAMMGAAAGDVLAAWIYVGLRIVHSLWQAFVNIVLVRFALFLALTTALLYLAYRAVSLTLLNDPGAI